MTNAQTGTLRALIVDDSRISRTKMQEMLQRAGFNHLDEAGNAEDAASMMDAKGYDIVFLDWVMPGKSGLTLLEQWREDDRYRHVAVIIVSAESESKMVLGALKAGALGYIVKPVVEEVLQENVAKAVAWLSQHGKLQDAKAQ